MGAMDETYPGLATSWIQVCTSGTAVEVLMILISTAWVVRWAAFATHKSKCTDSPLVRQRDASKDDAPCGGCLKLVNAAPCSPRGAVFQSNSLEECCFDSGVCHGSFVAIHKPTDDPTRIESGEYPYSQHMHGRRRLWEFRIQLRFREAIEGDVYFGCEQDRYYNLGFVERLGSNSVVSLVKGIATGMYQTHGDNPETGSGELERPEIVFPLWVMDQLVITEEGDQAPDICSASFPEMGMKKTDDRQAMRKAIDELKFVPGPTYTFGFWCISQFVDAIGWKVSARGVIPEVKLNEVNTHPPCYMTMYALKPRSQWVNCESKNDHRHLDSRKTYMWRVAFWSSHVPPEKSRCQELTAAPIQDNRHQAVTTKARRSRVACCF